MTADEIRAYGYIIADDEGRVQMQTFRTNRSECWQAFVATGDRKAAIRRMKRIGFHCIRVEMQGAE